MRRSALRIALACGLLSATISAHVGSPDVFVDAAAGPYRVLVTVRPPRAVPGVADVDVLVPSNDARSVRLVPLPLTGPGAQFAPMADVAAPSPADPTLFTGHLWMMSAGAWQVRITIVGDRGEGIIAVPVPTLPQATRAMAPALRAALFAALLLLCAGFVGIVSAFVRESRLPAGDAPSTAHRRRGRLAGAVAAGVCVGVVMLGNRWWSTEASAYGRYVYKPLEAATDVTADGTLRLTLSDPGWLASRRLDDFVPDHDHLMHLFVLSPDLTSFYHLHPGERDAAVFVQRLPQMPAGRYELFGDLVHATGVSETVTGTVTIGASAGAPLVGDDSKWHGAGDAAANSPASPTAGSGRIVWVRDQTPLVTKTLTMFTFRVENADGTPAGDLDLYMGMPGHAVFVKRDRSVFAHVHPSGSAPMAALQIAMPTPAEPHAHHTSGLPPTITFPYGFPEPGDYRIFVQVKRAGHVVTAVFDAEVH